MTNTQNEPVEVTRADQIRHMVTRFLGWRLPENFSPDAGISFKPTFNDLLPEPMRHEPVGTNLFDYTQAEQMVRYMLEGLPCPASSAAVDALRESKEGWDNVVEMGLLPRQHHDTARALSDKCSAALANTPKPNAGLVNYEKLSICNGQQVEVTFRKEEEAFALFYELKARSVALEGDRP